MAEPRQLIIGDGLAESWIEFEEEFVAWTIAEGRKARQVNPEGTFREDEKVAAFVLFVGPEGRSIFRTLFPNQNRMSTDAFYLSLTIKDVLKKFGEHCRKQSNPIAETHAFNKIRQEEGERFNEFLTRLRVQVAKCGFKCTCGELTESRAIRDRIVEGVRDRHLRLKLLSKPDLDEETAINVCRAYEAANSQCSEMDQGQQQGAGVDAVNNKCFKCREPWTRGHKCQSKGGATGPVICFKCGKPGHMVKSCWSNRKVDTVVDDQGKPSKREESKWIKPLVVNGAVVSFKIDTGAEVDIIPKRLVGGLPLKRVGNVLRDYNNKPIRVFGSIIMMCVDVATGKQHRIEFDVVEDEREPILGLQTSVALGIVCRVDAINNQLQQIVDQYKDCFEGLGKFPGKTTIHLKEGALPKLHYKKRFPFSVLDGLKAELNNLGEQGIISRVEKPTEWISNIQVVEKKDGSIRLCLDPRALNQFIQREHYLIPTIEDLTSGLSGKNIFTVLDLKSGFWHMELDEASSELTTFITPFGRFKFNRVPFGLNCAPEMFQRKMVQFFGDLDGVTVYFDDLLIAANDEKEHDVILQRVMSRAKENNVTFNREKVQYRKEEVEFMGHIISGRGIAPRKKYKDAILDMKQPENKDAVSRLLGLIKYISRVIPNRTQLTVGLRELVRADQKFEWKEKHEKELETIKKLILSNEVLALFDPEKETVVQTDASKLGLGCVLMQEGRPIAFASRTLSASEEKYAQIEKELLAITFACDRFHFYLYGRRFTVESDHQPLESLMKKDIDDVAMRLQRMMIKLLKYPAMSVVFKKGTEMYIADCLSRAQVSDIEEDQEITTVVHSVIKRACMAEDNYTFLKECMAKDDLLTKICKFVQDKWPGYHKLCREAQEFYKRKDELKVEKGVLFFGDRIVIPKELQKKIAHQLHGAHLGIEKTKSRARTMYFWPGMNADLERVVQECGVCVQFQKNPQKEPLIQDEAPRYPFHRVGIDVFEWAGKDFVSIYDSYSNYLIVKELLRKSADNMVMVLTEVFNAIGYPSIIRADNNPFNSVKMKEFAKQFNVVLQFSSPRYPQSNGLAEKGVAVAKGILKRVTASGKRETFAYGVLEYNNSPVATLGRSPSELFHGRVLKSGLAVSESVLNRKCISEKEIRIAIDSKREKQKSYYDRGAKELCRLNEGDAVMFRKTSKLWEYGKIVRSMRDRSYLVKDSIGNHFQRNRRHISRCRANKDVVVGYFDDDEIGDESTNSDSSEDSTYESFQEESGGASTESETTAEPASTRSEQQYTTRYGRSIRPPLRLDDYVT